MVQVKELKNSGYKPLETREAGIKTTYVGRKIFKDIVTGETIELEYLEKKVQHTLIGGWRRVYLGNFMELLTGLYTSTKKLQVIEFILQNLNSENQLTLTQNQVIEKTKISRQTVVDTYKYLIKNDFMKKQGAVYVVNPKFVCAFGSDKKNQTIAVKYEYMDNSEEVDT